MGNFFAPKGSSSMSFDTLLIIRLVAAVVLLVISLIFTNLPGFVCIVFMLLSTVVAGYDVGKEAYTDILEKKYYNTPVILTVITVISFLIGFRAEAAALILLYQIGLLLISYAEEKSKLSALELLQDGDESVMAAVSERVLKDGSTTTGFERTLYDSASFVLKIAMVAAVLYAIALPIFTDYGFIVSVHRAMMIILIATPTTVVISLPIAGIFGLCYSAKNGVLFSGTDTMEAVENADTVLFDSAGIFTSDVPALKKIHSDFLDPNTLITFVAHTLYYSEQPVAKAVAASFQGEYRLELVSDFAELPGCGAEAKIGGVPVMVVNRKLCEEKGFTAKEEHDDSGEYYYLIVSDRLVGSILIDAGMNPECEGLTSGMEEIVKNRCILFCEDGEEKSQHIADEFDFKEVYSECDSEKKLNIIREIKKTAKKCLVYVYSDGLAGHSAADVDIRVGSHSKYAEAIVLPDAVSNLPFAFHLCKRVKEICIENALFAFSVKAILIFLSMIGYCNLWFAIFIDMVAGVATILNSVRVTKESLITKFIHRDL